MLQVEKLKAEAYRRGMYCICPPGKITKVYEYTMLQNLMDPVSAFSVELGCSDPQGLVLVSISILTL